MPDYLICTQQLQQWNRPRPKHIEPIAVADIKEHQNSISKPKIQKKTRNSSSFDPRPLKHRHPSKRALEKLRTDLLCLGKPCSFSTILVPDVDVALHDHTYCKPGWGDTNEVTSSCLQIKEPCPYSSEESRALCNQVMEGLSVVKKK